MVLIDNSIILSSYLPGWVNVVALYISAEASFQNWFTHWIELLWSLMLPLLYYSGPGFPLYEDRDLGRATAHQLLLLRNRCWVWRQWLLAHTLNAFT